MFGTGLRGTLIGAIVTAMGALVLTIVLLEDPLIEFQMVRQLESGLLESLRRAQLELDQGGNPDRIADRVGAEHACRLTILSPAGDVLGDTAFDGDELVQARAWVSSKAFLDSQDQSPSKLTDEVLSTARHVVAVRDAEGRFIQATSLRAGVRATRASVRELLALGGVMAILVAFFLTWALSRAMVEPTRELTAVADRLASGDLAARTRSSRSDELGAIGRALDRMAVQLEDRMESLRAEEARLRTVLDSMAEGVFVTNEEGRIVQTNPALDRFVGHKTRGRTALQAIENAYLDEAVRTARERSAPSDVEFEMLRGERNLSMAAQVAPLPRQAGVVAVLRDVSRIKMAERVRRDFVANASHELRTPLTAVRGFAETLRDGALGDPAAAKRFINVILKHTHRLERLVADLAALSQAESPDQQLPREPVNVAALVDEVVDGLESQARKKRISLTSDIPATLGPVMGSEKALDQVLVNLIDNAIKYTPEQGRVTVHASTHADHVVISVCNTGPGIPKEHLSRIFERFYRVDPGRSRDMGGTGLGLAIVKHLVAGMEGDISADSSPEETTFRLRLQAA